jgi:uncharacterized repeat protein (TIGR01451 family)
MDPKGGRLMRRSVLVVAVLSLLVAFVPGLVPAHGGSAVGSFEIDGNKPDDTPGVEPIDWIPDPPNLTTFTDASGSVQEDAFGGGDKNLSPGTWDCIQANTGSKSDIVDGAIAFRRFPAGGDQFVYVNFTRLGNNGTADQDWELNQGGDLHPVQSCQGELPKRTDGDLIISFDEQGNTGVVVALYKWDGNAAQTTGTLTKIADSTTQSALFDGKMSSDRLFGEASINISKALGSDIECGEFPSAFMKSRQSNQINSDLTDRTDTQSLDVGECPNITSTKSASPNPANVGQQVTYTIQLSNDGDVAGTTDVIDDYDETHIQVDPNSISDNGTIVDGTIVWSNVSVPLGTNTQTLTYTGTVFGTFSGDPGPDCQPNQFPVENRVELSNGTGTEATLCVNGFATITSVKSAIPNPADIGQVVTYTIQLSNSGNITGTTDVTDDYDEDHIQIDPNSISDGGVIQNGTIFWNDISVPVGTNTQTLTYQGTVFGTFSGEPGPNCQPGQFPVQNDVSLDPGSGTSHTLCVNGFSDITSSKSASPNPANVGQVVTYTIQLSNSGNITGTTNVTDDYDEVHIQVDPDSISDGGTIVDGTIVWSNIQVAPGTNTQTLTYSGTVIGTFSGPPGPDCQPGQFPVENRVTLTNGGGTDNTLCVNAAPVLGLTKDTPTISVVNGQTITYTLTYSNTGTAEATNVIITDTLPAGTTFGSCSNNCTNNNGTVTWTIPSIPAGGGGFVTLTVNVVNADGCQICNQATIKIGANGSATSSNNKCVAFTPSANASGAHATGNATGANVVSSLLGLDLTLPTGNDAAPDHTSVDSSQSGVGSDDESNQVLGVDIPPPAPGSVLRANVLRAETVSTVTAVPSQARDTSVGSAANVNILNGTVTATLVRGVASATATGTSAEVSSVGSVIQGLTVLGIPQAVFPGARVDLPAPIFGPGSYVAIYEEIKNVSTPAGTSGGTYSADLTVNMIRVHVTNMLLVGTVEVVVGQGTAHADFPQTTLCGPQSNQSLSGSAFMVRALTDPSILPVIVGGVEIPTSGGQAGTSVNTMVVDPLVTSKAATSFTSGSFTSIASLASSYAEVKGLCILNTPTGCTISATVVRSQANSTATASSRSSDAIGTDFLALKVAGTKIALPVAPNTVISLPGIGFVVLNEQFCDNGGTLATNCGNGTVPGHTGITVRGIHLVLLDPAAGGTPGVEVIVSEAHSDAKFIAPAP